MHNNGDSSSGPGMCALLAVALLLLQASSVAKEQAAIMRYQVAKAERDAAACRVRP